MTSYGIHWVTRVKLCEIRTLPCGTPSRVIHITDRDGQRHKITLLANGIDADALRFDVENEQLATEVADRNRRALAGDEAVSALANVYAYYEGLEAQRDALLEALRYIGEYRGEGPCTTPWRNIVADLGEKARAAIAKAEAK